VVTRASIPGESVGKRVKGHRREAAWINVGERAHHPRISQSQEMEVVWMIAVFSQERDGVETRTVVMNHAFETVHLGAAVLEIPVASCAAIVPPVRNTLCVSENRIDADLRLFSSPEVTSPLIN